METRPKIEWLAKAFVSIIVALGLSVLGKDLGVSFGVHCVCCFVKAPWGRASIIASFKVNLVLEIRLGRMYQKIVFHSVELRIMYYCHCIKHYTASLSIVRGNLESSRITQCFVWIEICIVVRN